MAEAFNPYHVWLAIPPQEQPANCYRLLGLPLLESNPDVIDNAADQRTAHLRTFQSGKNGKFAEKLLNEVAAARVCLLDPNKKAAYDSRIRAWLEAQKAQAAGAAGSASARQAAPLSPAPQPSDWDSLLGDVESKPRKPVGSRPGAVGSKQKAKQRPIALFAVAGVLLAVAIGVGVVALNSSSADGTLALNWPADQREGATLTIDDAPVAVPASGAIERAAPPGEHRLSATHPLYQSWGATVTVAGGERQTVAVLWKPKAVVALDWPLKDRKGATLTLDGNVQSVSEQEPLELLVEPGNHGIRILRPNADPFQASVEVALGGQRTIVVSAAASPALLVVQWPEADRQGAQLTIDGQTPLTDKSGTDAIQFALKPGRHTLRITRAGFQPFEQTLELAAAGNKPLTPTWTPEVATNTQPATPDVGVTPTPTDTAPAKKLPVPSAEEQAELAKQLDELYKPTHTDADAAKAGEFYDLADKAKSPAERYMLLARGAELAAGAGDMATAFTGIDRLDGEYEIEPSEAKQRLLERAVAAGTTAEQLAALITAAGPLLDQAIAADRYDAALAIASTTSKALSKRPAAAQLRKDTEDLLARRRRDIHMLEPLYSAAQKAEKTLETSPDDAEANLTVGRWYSFYKNDWPRGLPLLAKGKDDKLKALAQAELKPPAATDEQVLAADAWWDASSKEIASVRDAIRLHAGDLYTAALPGLTSPLARIKIDKRMAEIAKLSRPVVSTAPAPRRFALGQWVDLLRLVDPSRDSVSGRWSRTGTDISCQSNGKPVVRLPVVIDGGYDLEIEFTRLEGYQDVDSLIPVGSNHCTVVLSGYDGGISALELIGGRFSNHGENPIIRRPGKLENGHRYRLLISVRLLDADQAAVDVTLDGKPYLPHWAGRQSTLGARTEWTLPDPRQLGLGAWNSRVTFHSVRLRMISGTAAPGRAATADVANGPIAGHSQRQAVSPSADGSLPLAQWVDVLKLIDVGRDTLNGKWSRDGEEISNEPGAYPHIELPVTIDGGYDLEVEFTRTDGGGCVGPILSVGTHRSMALLSGWNGAASGLDFLNGKAARDEGNPTSVRPGTLENGHRYEFLASVRMLPDDQASVDVSLDGKPYFPHWEGKPAALDLYGGWFMSHAKRPGLAAQSHTVFHAIRLRMISGSAKTDVPATAEAANGAATPQSTGDVRTKAP